MIPSAVVDSSIVMRWFIHDRWSDAALLATEKYRLIAPAFIKVEIASALRSQARFGGLPVDVVLRHLEGFEAQISVFDDGPLLSSAFRLAFDRDHPVYDCVYLALALRQGVPMLTADMKLARKFMDMPGLQILTPETL